MSLSSAGDPCLHGRHHSNVSLRMRNLYWASSLVLNLAVVAAFAPSIFASDVQPGVRVVGAMVALPFAAICAILVAARLRGVSSRVVMLMKALCCAIPVLWLAGSFDHGRISGLELVSVLFAALYAWATWRVFLVHAPKLDATPGKARSVDCKGAP